MTTFLVLCISPIIRWCRLRCSSWLPFFRVLRPSFISPLPPFPVALRTDDFFGEISFATSSYSLFFFPYDLLVGKFLQRQGPGRFPLWFFFSRLKTLLRSPFVFLFETCLLQSDIGGCFGGKSFVLVAFSSFAFFVRVLFWILGNARFNPFPPDYSSFWNFLAQTGWLVLRFLSHQTLLFIRFSFLFVVIPSARHHLFFAIFLFPIG